MRAEKIEALADAITDQVFIPWGQIRTMGDTHIWKDKREQIKQIIRKHCNLPKSTEKVVDNGGV
jgi:hypothetical protein